ncbi:hypothetical protein Tco_0905875 [Tanacetum coccineum]
MATKHLDADLSGTPVDQTKYRSMVGALMYLTASRPDIVHATCYCARYQAKPTEKHLTAVKRIFWYLKDSINMGLWWISLRSAGIHKSRTAVQCLQQKAEYVSLSCGLRQVLNNKDMFLVYGGNSEAELRVDCYCDAGFVTDRDDTKSQIGYVFILNGGAVDWKSSKQSTTAMSATDAEYIAALEAAMEAVWIRKFISSLGIVPIINEPIRMFCDNSAALHFANEPEVQKGTRHYHRSYHYVRECIALGEIRFLKVYTDDNLADPFTKALPKGKLTQHARSIGLCLASSFM